MLLNLALKEQNTEDARFLASKLGNLAKLFDMGKYNECSAMLNVVCAEKNVDGTYQVVKQLLENVDSLYDFRKSGLFRHMKFKSPDSSYPEWIRTKLLEGFRSGDEFSYMNGLDEWKKLIEE